MPKAAKKSPVKPAGGARRTNMQPDYICKICPDRLHFTSKEATSRKLHLDGHNLCIVWECVKCGRFKPDRRFHDMVEHIENVCKKSPYTWEDVKILTVSYTEAERLCPPRGTPKAESLEAAEGPTRSSLRTSSRSRHQSFESRSERRSLDHCRVETTSRGLEFRRAGEKREPSSRSTQPDESLVPPSSASSKKSPCRSEREHRAQKRSSQPEPPTSQKSRHRDRLEAVKIKSQVPSSSAASSSSVTTSQETSSPVKKSSKLDSRKVLHLSKFVAIDAPSSELEVSVSSGDEKALDELFASESNEFCSDSNCSYLGVDVVPVNRADLSPTSFKDLQDRLESLSFSDRRRLKESLIMPCADAATQHDPPRCRVLQKRDGSCQITTPDWSITLLAPVNHVSE